MAEITRERRAALRDWVKFYPDKAYTLNRSELLSLLDAADERDRLREARTLVLDAVVFPELFKENRSWLAGCVQWDFWAQGETREAALESLRRTIELDADGRRAEFGRPFAELEWDDDAAARWATRPGDRAIVKVTV